MTYYLAVDAGGTKTEFLLADEERELARVRTGSIKRLRQDEAAAERHLREGLDELTAATGISMRSVARTCVGTAGESVPLVADWLRSAFAAAVGGELVLVGDVEIALDAAFHGKRGVLVLAGTGSNVAGRAGSGVLFTAGGWGPVIGDQGSGYRIGLDGLQQAFLALDRQEPSTLLDAVLEHWRLPSVEALVEFANRPPAPDFSELAPLVAACAQSGDAVASSVLEQAGADLASLAQLVIERIQAAEGDGSPPPEVAVAGSVLQRIAPVREALGRALSAIWPQIRIVPAEIDPVSGALWRARKAG